MVVDAGRNWMPKVSPRDSARPSSYSMAPMSSPWARKCRGMSAAGHSPTADDAVADDPSYSPGADDSGDPTPEEYNLMSRSERKKFREKKRRRDVNQGFDELVQVLIQIEPGIMPSTPRRDSDGAYGKDSEEGGLCAQIGLNRVDLIAKTVEILRGVHEENQELRRQVEEQGGEVKTSETPSSGTITSDDNRKVPMLLPYLTPATAMLALARGTPAQREGSQQRKQQQQQQQPAQQQRRAQQRASSSPSYSRGMPPQPPPSAHPRITQRPSAAGASYRGRMDSTLPMSAERVGRSMVDAHRGTIRKSDLRKPTDNMGPARKKARDDKGEGSKNSPIMAG